MSKLEIIPQHIYTIDGIPAYKSGEWPGITGSKFNSSKLILKPIRNENKLERDSKHNTYNI